MSEEPSLSLEEAQKKWHGTLKAYVAGFILSLFLTLTAFLLVVKKALPTRTLILTVVALGLMQAIAQLLFFLHLGKESRPRWETLIFLFMVLVLLIIVGGTLWIMYDLDMRVMKGMMDD